MARGELSFSAVRALTRVAQPENEGDLLELARGCTTAQIEHMVRGWRRGSRKDEATLERELHETRTLSVFPDEEGMYVVRGRLDPEVGALLMRAIEAASDALFRERRVASRAARNWRTARAFQLKRPGGFPATSPSSASPTTAEGSGLPPAPCSTWGAGPEPSRRLCAGPSRSETGDAVSRGVAATSMDAGSRPDPVPRRFRGCSRRRP